ncbi:hypothetical protein HMPREF1406_01609 [Helicobacter pylori GAM239Bi]|nr:hypothetical protein HMPREF1406_01609 [Helicobacter pylori GAM239Bi]
MNPLFKFSFLGGLIFLIFSTKQSFLTSSVNHKKYSKAFFTI